MRSVKPRQDVGSLFQQLFQTEKREPLLVLALLRHEWPAIVGETLALKTRPHRLSKRILSIAATDACWAYELQFFKNDLLSSVQEYLGSEAVQDIRFQAAPEGPDPLASSGQPGFPTAAPTQPQNALSPDLPHPPPTTAPKPTPSPDTSLVPEGHTLPPTGLAALSAALVTVRASNISGPDSPSNPQKEEATADFIPDPRSTPGLSADSASAIADPDLRASFLRTFGRHRVKSPQKYS